MDTCASTSLSSGMGTTLFKCSKVSAGTCTCSEIKRNQNVSSFFHVFLWKLNKIEKKLPQVKTEKWLEVWKQGLYIFIIFWCYNEAVYPIMKTM